MEEGITPPEFQMKKRFLLSIETAGVELGVSLHPLTNQRPLPMAGFFFRAMPGRQSDLLVPTIDRLLKKKKVTPDQIGLVAVNVGPGSFTGVRVGVAVART